jgi:hypothetical protein
MIRYMWGERGTAILRIAAILAFIFTTAAAHPGFGQVKTDVPPVVPGATPVFVEHIKIHGEFLDGNLEGSGS